VSTTEGLDAGMVCTCNHEVGRAMAERVKARHPSWDRVETVLFALTDIGGPVTVYADQWFRVSCNVEWRSEGISFYASVTCDEVAIGAIVLYDEIVARYQSLTGKLWDAAVAG
jgi:hypothetical protein